MTDTTWNPHKLVPVRGVREQQSHHTTRGCSRSRGVRLKRPPGRSGPTQDSMRRAVTQPLHGISSGSGMLMATRKKIKQFQEVVGGLQDFRTYLLMKPGSAFVTILHSPISSSRLARRPNTSKDGMWVSSGTAQPRRTQHQSSCHNKARGSGTRRQRPRMQQR